MVWQILLCLQVIKFCKRHKGGKRAVGTLTSSFCYLCAATSLEVKYWSLFCPHIDEVTRLGEGRKSGWKLFSETKGSLLCSLIKGSSLLGPPPMRWLISSVSLQFSTESHEQVLSVHVPLIKPRAASQPL